MKNIFYHMTANKAIMWECFVIRKPFMEVLWGTYWATQWAAVKMCVLSISEPPQNCRPPLNRAAWIRKETVVVHGRIQEFMCGES